LIYNNKILKRASLLLVLTHLFFFVACESGQEQEKTLIGRVNDKYLYWEDIQGAIPKGLPVNDSILTLKRFVDNWIRETLLIQQAEDNLTDEQKNVEKELENYRNSLITYIYEKDLISQRLDTIISNEEVEKYYETHKDDFELKDNIVRVVYVKVNRSAPKIDQLKRWVRSNNMKDKEPLAVYCKQFAENYYLNDETWLYFDDLLKEIPIETYNKELFLKTNRYVEVNDGESIYLMSFKDFKITSSTSPFSFEVDNIRKIILNKRKMDLISKMREDIYNEALNRNKAQIYINEIPKK
jgi:hypothetical protein